MFYEDVSLKKEEEFSNIKEKVPLQLCPLLNTHYQKTSSESSTLRLIQMDTRKEYEGETNPKHLDSDIRKKRKIIRKDSKIKWF